MASSKGVWRKISQRSYQNSLYPRSSIQKSYDGWVVYSHGNFIGPFKTMAEAKKKGEPWIQQWLRSSRK